MTDFTVLDITGKLAKGEKDEAVAHAVLLLERAEEEEKGEPIPNSELFLNFSRDDDEADVEKNDDNGKD